MKKAHKLKKSISCPECGSTQGYTKVDNTRVCRYCGHSWGEDKKERKKV